MPEIPKENPNLPEGCETPMVITKSEAPSWLIPLLDVDVSAQEEIDIGVGTLRAKQITDGEGRLWECDDIRFREPFPDHFHESNLEIISVKGGRAKMRVGGEVTEENGAFKIKAFKQEIELVPGSIAIIPPNTPQGIEIIEGPLVTRVLMSPPYDPSTEFHISVSS